MKKGRKQGIWKGAGGGGVYEKKVVRKRRNGRWGAGLLGSKKRKGEWVR